MGWVWKERDSWRGAYRDESDKRHTKSFRRQIDATRWIATEEAKIVRGDWFDPTAGKVTFAAFYHGWAPRRVWVSSTREHADLATARWDADFAWGTKRVAQVERRDGGGTSGTR